LSKRPELRKRKDEAPTEELSWNSWVGRRPSESGPPSFPVSAETAEPRVQPGADAADKKKGRAGNRRRGPSS
jgi:hypothetical protein